MGIRAKQLLAGTFAATVVGRAPFGAGLFDLATASSVFATGAIPGAKLVSASITETQLASSVAGDGLTGGSGAVLAVGAGTGMIANANDVSLATSTGTVSYTGSHVSTHTISTLQVTGTPAAASDPTNKAYVDAVAVAQSKRKDAARLATVAALPTVTYANGTGGVGATLTATAVGVLTIDGVATVISDRILVQDQVAGLQSGIYEVTTAGTAGVAFVLTRTTDADSGAELESATIYILAGTANAGCTHTQTATPVTVGTTALTWVVTNATAAVLTFRQEQVTTEVITASDVAITDTLNNTPATNESLVLDMNGVRLAQGAGLDYTVSGTVITWLASSGTAPDLDTGDILTATYSS